MLRSKAMRARSARRLLAAAAVTALLAVVGQGCKKNQAATDACQETKDGEKCNACCVAQGAKHYVFASGGGCLCRD